MRWGIIDKNQPRVLELVFYDFQVVYYIFVHHTSSYPFTCNADV